MATYRFSTLAHRQAITFDPETDKLYFDNSAIAAATVGAFEDAQGLHVFQAGGKEVVLTGMSIEQITTSNIVFADGSRFLFGDNSLAAGDDGGNVLYGSARDDHLSGWNGDDTLVGRDGNDWIQGGNNDDRLYGGAGNDRLDGGDDRDTLDGGAGADTMAGGAADDVFRVDSLDDQVVEFEGGGSHDLVITSVDNYILPAWVNDLTLTGAAHTGWGNGLDNIMKGSAADNALIGQGGNDRLYGLGGDDFLYGADGVDTMIGGAGNDVYGVDDAGDVVLESAGGGIDRVSASIDYTLRQNIENLSISGPFDGFGNGLDNFIAGSDWANLLAGRGGDDTLSGNIDRDTLVGGLGADTFLFTSQPDVYNADVVRDFVSGDGDRLMLLNGSPPEPGGYPGNHADYGPAGTLSDDDARFYAAPGARSGHDADDRLVYDTTAGRLYYDADGAGAEAPALIYALSGAPQLSASDITIVDDLGFLA